MLKRIISSLLIAAFINCFVCPVSFSKEMILDSGTRIRLKLVDRISSAFNNEGEEVNFTVDEDVTVGDAILIRRGTRAKAIISELQPRGRIGKAGKFTIELDSVKAVDGEKIPLSMTVNRKGEEKVILSVALGVLLAPLGLLFLLMRGTDAQLSAGYVIQARVDRDVAIVIDDSIVPVRNIAPAKK